MSDRNDDFGFDDDDDIFGGRLDDDDDFLGGDADEEFGSFDDFDDENIDFEGDNFDFLDETPAIEDEGFETTDGGGPSRGFIIIAAILVIFLLLGFGILIFAILSGQDDPTIEQTREAILATNQVVEAALTETSEAATQQFFLDQTAAAASPTPTASDTPTPSDTPDADASATAQEEILLTRLAATQGAQNATLTAQADLTATTLALTQVDPIDMTATALAMTEVSPDDLTGTAIALTEAGAEPTEPDSIAQAPTEITPIEISAVQQTATALFEALNTTPTVELGTPIGGPDTAPPGQGGGGGVVTQPDNLPDTGLFDDVAGGNTNVLFLMAFGLVGVIFVSRRMRSKV